MNPPPAGLIQIENLFKQIVNISVVLAFIVVFIVLVWAGIKFITSGGDADSLQSAWQAVTWALLGILFLVLAWLILTLIATFTGMDALKEFDIRGLCGDGGFEWCPTPIVTPFNPGVHGL